jgi:probable rRNA maturation factor
MILVEADISPEWDRSTDWEQVAQNAVAAAVAHSQYSRLAEAGSAAEVSIKLTDDEEVRALNAAWRAKDRATNVLSFPMVEPDRLGDPAEPMLGDIVLAHGVCAAEAADRGLAVADHAAHLMVHGMLHLLGYDHETNAADAEEMEATERRALASLGIADPYLITEVNG